MNRNLVTFIAIGVILANSPFPAPASEWPHWLGPNRNGKVAEKITETPSLDVLWEVKVGWGYSALAVADDRAYTLGHDSEAHETIYCLDAKNGKTLWSHKYEAKLIPSAHLGGPNAMPTIEKDLLYTVSKDGQVFCLNAKSGVVQWHKNLVEAYDIELPNWGFASAPLIVKNSIIISGPKTIAISKKDGGLIWQSKSVAVAGYATPLRFAADKQDLLAVLSGKKIAVHSIADGKQLAGAGFSAKYDMTAATPVLIQDGQFFISCNTGGRMLRYAKGKLETVWESSKMKNTMATSVVIDGHLYGLSGKNGSRHSSLTCMRVSDGEVRWKEPGMGAGTLIATGKRLLVLSESGEVVIAEATPEAFKVVARKQILEKTCWTPPSFADGNLFIRNDRGRVACVSLGK